VVVGGWFGWAVMDLALEAGGDGGWIRARGERGRPGALAAAVMRCRFRSGRRDEDEDDEDDDDDDDGLVWSGLVWSGLI
jgi:hypothetical protein